MKSFEVIFLTVFLLVCSAEAFFGDGFRRQPPPSFGRGPPSPPFPKCQEFYKSIEDQMRKNRQNGEGGPQNCRNKNMSPPDCRFEDMTNARNQLMPDLKPSQECRDQVNGFLDGQQPSTTEGSLSSST